MYKVIEVFYITENCSRAVQLIEEITKDLSNKGIYNFSFHKRDLLFRVGNIRVVFIPMTGSLIGRGTRLVKYYVIDEIWQQSNSPKYIALNFLILNDLKIRFAEDVKELKGEKELIDILCKAYRKINVFEDELC